jgi:hypothetical protein
MALVPSKDKVGAIQSLQRAAIKARQLAERTKTPFYVFVDGRVVDLNPQPKPDPRTK